jgi:cyclic beta-1,2-glucan synthetase
MCLQGALHALSRKFRNRNHPNEIMANVSQPVNIFAEIEEPICAELFSVERLEQRAESLAASQTVTNDSDDSRPLIPRVAENGCVLFEYYRATARAMQREETITSAAEWLVDNFYIVEEQLRKIRDDLSPGIYRRLPKLASGHLQGYPRVLGIAWAFVAHTDSQFDPEVLRQFVSAYQRVRPLTIGELWAVAITLRVVLVENLRRLAERLVRSLTAREEADVLADSLIGTGGNPWLLPPRSCMVLRKNRWREPLPCGSCSACATWARKWGLFSSG